MPYLVRAFPLIRPVVELQQFLSALSNAKRAEASRFYREYGVSHESAYLQETQHGNILIVVTLLADQEEAAPRYRAASEEFHTWFKEQVFYLSGIDPNVTPLGPPTTQMFCWPTEPDE
ncbi:MAG: hypothetical protein JF606_17015 [Burkholderiales bacterium]|nr:hypothetical protein [Burkholderiales bacterium]